MKIEQTIYSQIFKKTCQCLRKINFDCFEITGIAINHITFSLHLDYRSRKQCILHGKKPV